MKISYLFPILLCLFAVHAKGQNVGVGTSNPQYLLDVDGTTRTDSLRITNAPSSSTDATDNNVLILESNGDEVRKARFGGKYDDISLTEVTKTTTTGTWHYLTNAELFGGNAQDNASVIAGSNGLGNFQSLYNGVRESGAASFHFFRQSPCSAADWGFEYTFDAAFWIDQIDVWQRTDCCNNRKNNIIVQFLDGSNNVLLSRTISGNNSDYSALFSAVYASKIRFYIANCGNVGTGEDVMNFSDFRLYGWAGTTTTVQSASIQNYPTFNQPLVLGNLPNALNDGSELNVVVDNQGVLRKANVDDNTTYAEGFMSWSNLTFSSKGNLIIFTGRAAAAATDISFMVHYDVGSGFSAMSTANCSLTSVNANTLRVTAGGSSYDLRFNTSTGTINTSNNWIQGSFQIMGNFN